MKNVTVEYMFILSQRINELKGFYFIFSLINKNK